MRQSAARRLILDDTGGVVLGAELWQFDSRSVAAARHRRLSRWAEAMFYVAPRLAEILRHRTLQIELADARPKHVRARGGVILSTGGFIFNRAMVSRYAPKYLRNFPLGTCGCDGSGIRLGQSVGGDAARMDRITAWRFINPPLAWSQGMIVDAEGRRFCNEEVYGARLGYEICERHDGKAWLVMDSTIRREAIREAVFGNLWAFQRMPALMLMFAGAKRGGTIEALARKISAQEKSLAQSLTEYNLAAERGEDPRGKSAYALIALLRPQYLGGHAGVSVSGSHFGRAARGRDHRRSAQARRWFDFRPVCGRPGRAWHRIESLRQRPGPRRLHLVRAPRRRSSGVIRPRYTRTGGSASLIQGKIWGASTERS